MIRRLLRLLGLLTLAGGAACAQYVTLTGTLQAANGLTATNYTLALQPSQIFYIAGTAVVVNTSVFCATSSDGTVVGTGNPLHPFVGAVSYTGTLGTGTYFLQYVWYDAAGHGTLPSSEQTLQLTATGSLLISPPASGVPATAVGMRVYIGATSGSETLQGSTNTPTATYTQSVPLVSGSAVPTTNTTICSVVANDAGWPTGTGYNVTLSDPSGNTIPGYPMLWRFLGPNTTINLSNGLPTYNGLTTYPVPILATPYNHTTQSISGPLSLTGYDLLSVGEIGVGTALPAWGVDVEGAGLAGAVNANNGYLFNGAAPANHVLLGNGSYYVDSATIPYSILSGSPALYYQTMNFPLGSALPQEPNLGFDGTIVATDDPTDQSTHVGLPAKGTAGNCTFCSLTFDAQGRETAQSSGSTTGLVQEVVQTVTVAGCTFGSDGNGLNCSATGTLSPGFADTNYTLVCAPKFSNTIATTTSAMPAMGLSWTILSGTGFTVVEALNNGSSTGFDLDPTYGVQINCIAEHN